MTLLDYGRHHRTVQRTFGPAAPQRGHLARRASMRPMQETTGTGDVVTRDVPPEWVDAVSEAIPVAPDAAVIFLPEGFDNGVAVFPAGLAHIVKELRAEGVDAAFLPGRNGTKTFVSRYSAEDASVISGIVLNVLSGGIWDAIKVSFQLLRLHLVERRNSGGSHLTTFRMGISRKPDGTEIMWQEFSGPSEAAVLAHAENATRMYLAGMGLPPGEPADKP